MADYLSRLSAINHDLMWPPRQLALHTSLWPSAYHICIHVKHGGKARQARRQMARHVCVIWFPEFQYDFSAGHGACPFGPHTPVDA